MKDMQGLYTDNYKALFRYIKENLNKQGKGLQTAGCNLFLYCP